MEKFKKKKPIVVIFSVVFVFLFLFLCEIHSEALEKDEYVNNMMSNIDTSYEVLTRQMEGIHDDMEKMKVFFLQDALMVASSSDDYYQILVEIKSEIDSLDKYVSSLDSSCKKIERHKNNKCGSYQKNIDLINENFDEVVLKYNSVIKEYNKKTVSDLKVFGE